MRMPTLVRELSPTKDAFALAALVRLIRRERYDIVHTHTAKAGILGRFAAARARTPCIIHGLHGMTFHQGLPRPVQWLYRVLERTAARRTQCIVSVGEDLVRRYLAAGVGEPHMYRVIYSGMPLDEYEDVVRHRDMYRARARAELGLGPNDVVLGQVARLEPRKGFRFVLDCLVRIQRRIPNARLLIVGEGPDCAALERRAAALGVAEHVVFTGYREDVAEVMAAMDVFCFASLWEGLPQVLVQAAALGLPIVTFEVEGASEVVHDGVNGYVVPSLDVDAMSERVAAIVLDPSHARAMGDAGRRIVGRQWSVDTQQSRTVELYDELVERYVRAQTR
jgi:glycosyltransferase involved in cell wall biosynthesis